MTTWQIEQQQKSEALFNELTSLGYKCEYKKNNDGDFMGVLIGSVCVKPKDYRGKYSFFLDSHYVWTDCYTRSGIMEKLKAPNQVGVLSKRKIDEWIVYLNAVNVELKLLSDERQRKIDGFIEELSNQPVQWREKGLTGRIDKNGLSYTFDIDRNSGYISQRMEIDYSVDRSIKNFLLLADNKYQR